MCRNRGGISEWNPPRGDSNALGHESFDPETCGRAQVEPLITEGLGPNGACRSQATGAALAYSVQNHRGSMSGLSKGFIAGVLTGVLGFVLSITSAGLFLEESMGLHWLFKLRGTREPPPDVVVVSIDKASAEKLGVPGEPEDWPHYLHAQLIEILDAEGSAVIVFDVFFEEPCSAEDDKAFARAMKEAGNVALCGHLTKKTVDLNEERGTHGADASIETFVPPTDPLAESASAIAVFPLPKVPVRVNQCWTFKASAGDVPTLPVVAFQLFARDLHGEFIKLLKEVSLCHREELARWKETMYTNQGIEKVIQAQRALFRTAPFLGQEMLEKLDRMSLDPRDKQILRSLIRIYQNPSSFYLNFYGPATTITTIPYDHIVPHRKRIAYQKYVDFEGKAVFVGVSENLQSEQRDGFYTVFSQATGVDISGVEIAATAFANFLEDMPIRPLSMPTHLGLLLVWGIWLGILCRIFSTLLAAISLGALSLCYLLAAEYQFECAGLWYPVVIPLMFQGPVLFFGTVLWKYIETSKEREDIRKAFGHYLPDKIVDQIAQNIGEIGSEGQVLYGICLCTDAEQYTALSESMDPKELNRFLNKYYEAVFGPIRNRGGIVSDVVGDSIMALWTTTGHGATLRHGACAAALDIASAVDRFNQSSEILQLPTRIGLHSGYVFVGNVGAMDHYEYRAVGDIVNTVSRIERVNKQLGTRILASGEVVDGLDDLLTRELGQFVLRGKAKPVLVHELICRVQESDEKQRMICSFFSEALSAFRKKLWKEATAKFEKCLQVDAQDGPSQFYLALCKRYLERPPAPEEACDESICLD